MRKLVVVLALAGLVVGGCSKGTLRADAIKPSVDIIVPEFKKRIADGDDHADDLRKLADELKRTVDEAVAQ